jgi:glycosyltransferase involved in cell wall biosynthesis
MVTRESTPGGPRVEDRPLVSIGVPTCDRSALLRRALSSLVAQDYPNLEIVVSDNASTDDTATVCAEMARQHSMIHYHRAPVRTPVFQNFRNALVRSHGDYFMWASDDDVWEPTFVGTLAAILDSRTDLMLVAAEAQYVLNDGTRLPPFAEGKAFYGRPRHSALRRMAMIARHGYGNLLYGLYRRAGLIDPTGRTAIDVCTFHNELPVFVLVADRGGIQVCDAILFYKTTSRATYCQAAREYGFVPRLDHMAQVRDDGRATGLRRWSREAAGTVQYHARTLRDIYRALGRIRGGPGVKVALLLVFVAWLTVHCIKLALVWPLEDVLSNRVRS